VGRERRGVAPSNVLCQLVKAFEQHPYSAHVSLRRTWGTRPEVGAGSERRLSLRRLLSRNLDPCQPGLLAAIAVQISWMIDCLVLILLAKMQPNHVFRKQVGVDRENAEAGALYRDTTRGRALIQSKRNGAQHGIALPAPSGYRKKLIWTGLGKNARTQSCVGPCKKIAAQQKQFATKLNLLLRTPSPHSVVLLSQMWLAPHFHSALESIFVAAALDILWQLLQDVDVASAKYDVFGVHGCL
jgi:hypothetical protein